MKRRATQRDVARLAGVSQATVSIVLTGASTPSISADTWQRITNAARELGYTPNRFAQALRTNRSMTIACLVPDITNPFYPALIRGVQSVTDGANYDLITISTDGLPEREQHFLDWARQGRADGIIGVFFTLRAQDLKPLVDGGVPVVRIESAKKRGGEIPIDDIFVDSHAAALAVTRFLIARGHRRIGMIAGRGGPQGVRVDGYRQALVEAGGTPQVVLDDEFSETGGSRAAKAMLASGERPTAIFAANDLMAIGVIQALREADIAVPGDVSVVGFDDISAARMITPPLTTVAQFQRDMGAKAAQTLMERLSGARQGAGTALEVPFSLIERAST